MSIVTLTAIVTLVIEVLMNGVLIAGLTIEGFQPWPPPFERDWKTTWQFWFNHGTFGLAVGGFVIVGFLTRRANRVAAWGLTVWPWCLILVGLVLAGWGMYNLNMVRTLGKVDGLVTSGPYRFIRNPQYVGDILASVGWMLWTLSTWSLLVGILLVLWLLLVPFVEEDILQDELGAPYREYRQEVPRFLGV